MLQTNLDTLLFVASYYVVSYYRFLNTDPGAYPAISNYNASDVKANLLL
jgi:hypothetical protein